MNVRVLALVGVSPGVVTELLWWLVTQEHTRVSGLELWGTERIRRDLNETVPGLYAQLRDALGARSDWVPSWNLVSDVVRDPRAEPAPLQLFFPNGRDGRPLEDVANALAAEDFARAIDRRMERLRETAIPLVGSLAGGRKAMGTALHAAFTLRARRGDRLVHVLLHPAVERALGPDVRRYACPRVEIGGVPVADQLSVYAVPFVPVGELAAGSGEHDLLASLQRVLHEVAGEGALGFAPARDARCVDLVLDGVRLPLGWATAAYFAALVEAGALTPAAVLARVREAGFAEGTLVDSVDHALRKLRTTLKREVLHRGDLRALIPERRPSRTWSVGGGATDTNGLSLQRLQTLRAERSPAPRAPRIDPTE